MDKIIHDANSEIMSLRDKLSAMQSEQKSLEQKNHELAGAFREKAKHQQHLQKLYSSLKQQQLAAGIELAAEHDAEHVVQAAGIGSHGKTSQIASHQGQGHPVSSGSGGGRRIHSYHAFENQVQGSRLRMGSSRSAPVPATPPRTNRIRLPVASHTNNNGAVGKIPVVAEQYRPGMTYRSALHPLDHNVHGHHSSTSYRMSAGFKTSKREDGLFSRPSIGGQTGVRGRQTSIGGLPFH